MNTSQGRVQYHVEWNEGEGSLLELFIVVKEDLSIFNV